MKTTNFILFVCSLLCILSCRTLSYFESPNNLRNIEGTLYLKDGKTLRGKLQVETENLFGGKVKLQTEEDRKQAQFSLNQVKGYSVGDDMYELKEIREGISIGRKQFFMQRLTPENSRMHVFSYAKKETVNKSSTRYITEYYVQLPNEAEDLVHSSNGSRFVPHFEEKVSRMVGDCPSLAKKIAGKQAGYFYAQVNLVKEKRADVLLRIIDEYNRCAK